MPRGQAGRKRERTAMATNLHQAAGSVAEMSPGSPPLLCSCPRVQRCVLMEGESPFCPPRRARRWLGDAAPSCWVLKVRQNHAVSRTCCRQVPALLSSLAC